MRHLPVELQRQCVENANFKTLKALRLVDKATSILASELLFHTLNLFPTDESAAKFYNILEDSTLNSLVRRAIFNTSLDPEADTCNEGESEVLDSFRDSIDSVSRFPNVREVDLKFSCECLSGDDKYDTVAECEEFRAAVLEIFFGAVRGAANVNTLTIKNIHDATGGDICKTEDFKVVCSRLKKLNIQVATEYDSAAPENSLGLAVGNDFFGALTTYWLKPIREQLTHVTIYSAECFWGIYPGFDCDVHFPKLKSLSLGNYTIAHNAQIKWILEHGDTLEVLLLDDCPIITAMCMDEEMANSIANFDDLEQNPIDGSDDDPLYFKLIDLRWHHVFPQFQSGLPHLKHFSIGHGDWGHQRMFEQRYNLLPRLVTERYHGFDCRVGPTQWVDAAYDYEMWNVDESVEVEYPACDEEDHDALDALLEAVSLRNGGKGKLPSGPPAPPPRF